MFPSKFAEFLPLAEAAFNVWAPDAKVSYNPLQGGRSGALVLKVDVRQTQRGIIEPGQYVLKLSKYSKWLSEAKEVEAHRRAVARNEGFAKDHITRLVQSVDLKEVNGYAMLFEIAGASLDTYIPTNDRESPYFISACEQIVSQTLSAWGDLEPKGDKSPHEVLKDWLGYRLDPIESRAFHTFIEAEMGQDMRHTEGAEVILNPIKFYELAKNEAWSAFGYIDSLIHNDLHGGNILVNRNDPAENPFWLIDFGLSTCGPIGYDQAYLEVAQIIYCLGNSDPARLVGLLKFLDYKKLRPMLTQGTYWLYDCLSKMRTSIVLWRDDKHPRRTDDINRQLFLARIAAGLNWANKTSLSGDVRYLALCYAGWYAREYVKNFEPTTWESLWQRDGHVSLPLVKSETAVESADEVLWQELWETVGGFSTRAGRFVLVAESQDYAEDPKVLSAVGQLPWSAVIDLDPYSDSANLNRHAAPILQSHRGLHIFNDRLPIIDVIRGTAWMMAGGWATKSEAPQNYTTWIYNKLHLIREFIKNIEYQSNPDPIFVIVLPGGTLDKEMPMARITKVVGAIDEITRGRAKIIVLGSRDIAEPIHHLHIPIETNKFLEYLVKTFGYRANKGTVQIPGKDGVWNTIPIDILRTIQENLAVLHSNILEESSDSPATEQPLFWRGHPPSWADIHAGLDIPRALYDPLKNSIEEKLEIGRNYTVVMYHHPGAGGTSMARRVAWDLHWEHPVASLICWSPALATRLQNLYRIAERPVLLIAEASDLTESRREDLHRELSQANTPVILLYIRRVVQKQKSPLSLYDPMTLSEAKMFYRAYSRLTTDEKRQKELERITNDKTLSRFRSPFFYGLITFERNFDGVERYVASHLMGVRGKLRDIFEYLALITVYSNTGLHETLLKKILGISEGTKLEMIDIFGDGPVRLISNREGSIRLLHHVIAEEVLRELTGGGGDWHLGLHHLSIDFIREITSAVNTESQVIIDMFRQLFIDRFETIIDDLGERQRFSPLIEEIDSIDKSLGHRIFISLTECCPNEAHFWNHLGRHQVYRVKRDIEKAENYLGTAIRLSPYDYIHYHTLGIVLRYRVRQLSRGLKGKTGIEILTAISEFFNQAVDAFEKTRDMNPENIYGYITHVQMILEVAENLRAAEGAKNIGQISLQDQSVVDWLNEHIPIAHKLLSDAQQLYGTLDQQQDSYLTACFADLRKLYGDIDQVIRIWELANAKGLNTASSRRALANAYLVRNKSRWSDMQLGELRRIVALMEQNLRSSGQRDEDYRYWFEGYSLLPEFDVDEALSKLRLWVSHFPSWRAYYYIYIIHFHLWFSGKTDSLKEIEEALEQCERHIIGRRNISYQWLGYLPENFPLISAGDMGSWDKNKGFWEDSHLLRRVNGIIDDPIPGPQAGWIKIDGLVKAFFVPAASDFSPHQDENAQVSFFLGFSPVGLRAWAVERGHVLDGDRTHLAAPKQIFVPKSVEGPTIAEEVKRARSKSLRIERVMQFVEDFLMAKINLGADITVSDLEDRLKATFGLDDVISQLGLQSIESLLKDNASFRLVADGKSTFIVGALTPEAKDDRRKAYSEQTDKITGYINYYHTTKCFGFINDASPKTLWFGKNDISARFRSKEIIMGQIVEFRPDENERGRIATEINFLNEAPEFVMELSKLVRSIIIKILNDANDAIGLGEIADKLNARFRGKEALLHVLGASSFSELLRSMDKIRVEGQYPDLVVRLVELG